jgi:hypothetical protein
VLLMRYRDLRDSPAEALDRVCAFLGVRTGVIGAVPSENVTPYVPDTPLNAVLRTLLRTGGRLGQHFPVPLRLAARGPLLTALHRQSGRRPRLTQGERATILPYFTEDIAVLENVTGESYQDWLDIENPPRPHR